MLTLRLGTRGSPLAVAQSRQVAAALEAANPGVRVMLVTIVTRGDRLPGDLAPLGGKGLFTEELEAGLLDGSLDLAVHSLKDLPGTLAAGLIVAACPPRADARDVLVSDAAVDLAGLPPGAVVLTGSLRRRAQLLLARPDLRVEGLRGNIDTRLRRWRESGAAGLLLAAAGLDRLGPRIAPAGAARGDAAGRGASGQTADLGADRRGDAAGETGTGRGSATSETVEPPAHPLAPAVMLPAPGQGTLAIEVRQGGRAEDLCRVLDDPPTAATADAERRVVAAFGGDCTLPLAAWARWDEPDMGVPRTGGQTLTLSALLATPDGRHVARGEATGDDATAAAAACIDALRQDGADEVLERIRAHRG